MKSAIFVSILAATIGASPLEPRQSSGSTLSVFNSNTPSSSQITQLTNALAVAPGYAARQSILVPNPPDATNMTFQFVNNTVSGNTGGTIALSTLNNFPALIGTQVALAVGFVNACGLNVPHSHPRGNEFLAVIQGELTAGLILEQNTGSFGNAQGMPAPVSGNIPMITANLTDYRGMLFPRGESHFQFNPTCKPAVFAAAFDSSDPGRTQIARNFFSNMPDSVLEAALGDATTLSPSQLSSIRSKIPTAFATLISDCAKKCGIPS